MPPPSRVELADEASSTLVAGGREVLKRQLGGELTISGLVLRSRSVVRLLSA